jgi:hypothetical protein
MFFVLFIFIVFDPFCLINFEFLLFFMFNMFLALFFVLCLFLSQPSRVKIGSDI